MRSQPMTDASNVAGPDLVKAAGKLVAEGVVLSPALLLHFIAAFLVAIDLVTQGAGAQLWLLPLGILASVAIPFVLWAVLLAAAQAIARSAGIAYQPVLLALALAAAIALGPTAVAAMVETVGPLVSALYLGSYGLTMLGLFAWRNRLGLGPLFGEPALAA